MPSCKSALIYCRGYCKRCFTFLTRNGLLKSKRQYVTGSLKERFDSYVSHGKPNECWEWKGSTASHGYGQLMVKSKPRTSHTLAYELFKGPIPKGLHVLHSCDNRKCVNPNHLRLGTNHENVLDCKARGRNNKGKKLVGRFQKGSERPNAKLTENDVRWMRYAKAFSGCSNRQLEMAFGLSSSTVSRILSGQMWQHV